MGWCNFSPTFRILYKMKEMDGWHSSEFICDNFDVNLLSLVGSIFFWIFLSVYLTISLSLSYYYCSKIFIEVFNGSPKTSKRFCSISILNMWRNPDTSSIVINFLVTKLVNSYICCPANDIRSGYTRTMSTCIQGRLIVYSQWHFPLPFMYLLF